MVLCTAHLHEFVLDSPGLFVPEVDLVAVQVSPLHAPQLAALELSLRVGYIYIIYYILYIYIKMKGLLGGVVIFSHVTTERR